ncbi:diadenylate cyclase CdaA, partial [Aureispira]|nr:diadenylate cyclase CdaA [Aureispira sp.]
MIYLIQIGFFTISFWDLLDILIVGVLLYYVYKLLKGSLGFNIFVGLVLVYISWRVVSVLEMPLLSSILGQFVSIGMIALLILFQPEVRRFLVFVGQGSLKSRFKFLDRFFKQGEVAEIRSIQREKTIREITRAVEQMATDKTGSLIVLTSSQNLDGYYSSGVILDGNVSQQLILSVFSKNSPLHDGAMIIKDGKVIAASCVLPLSHRPNIPQRLGLRHRAAVGISENTNVLAFVVSEETGKISF